ncbi:FAD/NAD(P)-binding domain-containing protein [Heliocybe sulcata]|uniref:Kynurenine 3-monooxygenase n=1 Tax=Heliocybe sulcata TaxID=5364 RepID=A0A5C3NCC1_9AGAM|nr:FAD/NAD(P)-binding domain-containing protein [Heliocybe sulcata]
MELPPPRVKKVVVVGAGPVGCLSAMAMARMGWDVEVYDGRPDLRLPSSKAAAQQRSINLAISSRGISALQAIDPAATDRFLQTVIPMRGRMIHDSQGQTHSQLYDRYGQCINSIDRALLNQGLLDEASSVPNVRIFFKHKVNAIDFEEGHMTIKDLDSDLDRQVPFDFCIGADGSYSVVRRQLMRVVRMDYQQEYIPHEYVELKMPAGRDESGNPAFLLDPNHLHIWPRHSFMLIALPNKDKTFTCTLFAPTTELDGLRDQGAVLAWFKRYFPDAVQLIGQETLLEDFQRNPRSPLMSIKAKPYHYKDRAILLGDAAHSMVPFYGQGLNCGLEDVRVLDSLLRAEMVDSKFPENSREGAGIQGAAERKTRMHDGALARALQKYSDTRHKDLVAIRDLAMDNYVEMRHAVTTPTYLFRKAVDNLLYLATARKPPAAWDTLLATSSSPFPAGQADGEWLPLYTMVTFRPDISYDVAKSKAERQSRILLGVGWCATAVTGIACIGLGLAQLNKVCRRA